MDEELKDVLERFYGEYTISHMARIILEVMEPLGVENLVEELQKLV